MYNSSELLSIFIPMFILLTKWTLSVFSDMEGGVEKRRGRTRRQVKRNVARKSHHYHRSPPPVHNALDDTLEHQPPDVPQQCCLEHHLASARLEATTNLVEYDSDSSSVLSSSFVMQTFSMKKSDNFGKNFDHTPTPSPVPPSAYICPLASDTPISLSHPCHPQHVIPIHAPKIKASKYLPKTLTFFGIQRLSLDVIKGKSYF